MSSLVNLTSLFVLLVLGIMGFTMLSLSFRDTLLGIREFYDPALFRTCFRSLRNFRGQFSLRTFLLASTFLPPCMASAFRLYWSGEGPDSGFVALLAGYVLLLIVPPVHDCYTDTFGVSPRVRWRKYRCLPNHWAEESAEKSELHAG